MGSVILSKIPSSDSEVKESLQRLVQGKHRGSGSAPRYHAAPETSETVKAMDQTFLKPMWQESFCMDSTFGIRDNTMLQVASY